MNAEQGFVTVTTLLSAKRRRNGRHSPRAPASNTLTPAKIVERYERSK
jgi:hypothetical protein